jgi:antitoxin ParD1/3/4
MMSTMELKLPDSVKDFLEGEVAAKGYKSASQYLTSLLRALQRRRAWDNLEALALEGLATPAREMTHADWQRLRARVLQSKTAPKKKK